MKNHEHEKSCFFYRKFSDYSQVIMDIHNLFIETTDVGDLLTGAFVK